jgi:hypothetical protein
MVDMVGGGGGLEGWRVGLLESLSAGGLEGRRVVESEGCRV